MITESRADAARQRVLSSLRTEGRSQRLMMVAVGVWALVCPHHIANHGTPAGRYQLGQALALMPAAIVGTEDGGKPFGDAECKRAVVRARVRLCAAGRALARILAAGKRARRLLSPRRRCRKFPDDVQQGRRAKGEKLAKNAPPRTPGLRRDPGSRCGEAFARFSGSPRCESHGGDCLASDERLPVRSGTVVKVGCVYRVRFAPVVDRTGREACAVDGRRVTGSGRPGRGGAVSVKVAGACSLAVSGPRPVMAGTWTAPEPVKVDVPRQRKKRAVKLSPAEREWSEAPSLESVSGWLLAQVGGAIKAGSLMAEVLSLLKREVNLRCRTGTAPGARLNPGRRRWRLSDGLTWRLPFIAGRVSGGKVGASWLFVTLRRTPFTLSRPRS